MRYESRLVLVEPEVPYAFSLCRVTDAGTADEGYDLLGTMRVVIDSRGPERIKTRMREWALSTLDTGGYGFGRYHVALGTLDEDGEPDLAMAEDFVDWSGSAPLVPADQATA